MAHAILFLLLKYMSTLIILGGRRRGIYMIEKYTSEVILDVRIGNEEDLKHTIEEIKAYAKTYEHDKVTLIDLKKSHSNI